MFRFLLTCTDCPFALSCLDCFLQAATLLLFNETPELAFPEVQEKLNLQVRTAGCPSGFLGGGEGGPPAGDICIVYVDRRTPLLLS